MYRMDRFYKDYGEHLGLELIAGKEGLTKGIKRPEIYRPGLSLAGYLKHFDPAGLLIFGRSEMEYLKVLKPSLAKKRLKAILTVKTSLVLVTRKLKPLKEIKDLCEINKIPLFRTPLGSGPLSRELTIILHEELAVKTMVHGTLVEVFGIGILIQGESSIGKSEIALGLLEKGHRLISDDVVYLKKKGTELIGSSPDLTKHMMEIRAIGIIHVAHLFGAVSIRPNLKVDFVVKLEKDTPAQKKTHETEEFCEILGLSFLHYTISIRPGHKLVLLLETLALNYRLKMRAGNSFSEVLE